MNRILNETPPEGSPIPLFYKIMLQKLFDVYEHGEKGHSTECLFGHFHKREKQAVIFNFSESVDFSVTKFTLQFIWILQFLKIIERYTLATTI